MPTDKRQRQRELRAARQAELRRAQQRRKRTRQGVTGGILAVIVIAVLVLSSSSGNKKTKVSTTSTTAGGPAHATPQPAGASITGPTPCPKDDGSSPRTTKFAQAPPVCINPAKTYTATFDTSEGKIEIKLDTQRTPQTANNFVVLSRYHYYDGTSIFRTDTSIDILQGGGPTTESPADPGPGYSIKDEGGKFTYQAGDFVMARSQGPDSGAAQFFIVTGPKASALNGQGTYVTFGHITSGLDVAQKILGLNKDDPTSGLGGAPSRVVTVKTVTIKES